jgi:hypothetical protein
MEAVDDLNEDSNTKGDKKKQDVWAGSQEL